jgi:hypothetical protein
VASIFISYSHADQALARALAETLRRLGFKVWIDEGELKVGDSLIERIATAIADIDFFLALVSESSVGSKWCRKELALAVTGELGREGVRVLPVQVDGAAMPPSLADVYYLKLDHSNVDEVAQAVADAIPKHQAEQQARHAKRAQTSDPAPAVSRSTPSTTPAAPPEFEPIKIIGIVEEGVGRPRNDGSPGSALYRIPLRLSRRPDRTWADYFVQVWDRPPRVTTMHRPGIASVSGDTVILDGTTMEELERYHVDTLRLVLDKANADVAEHERQRWQQAQREEAAQRQHEETVEEISGRLKFE